MPNLLILGAHSDMAEAVARRFAREGYTLTLAARRMEALSALKKDLEIRQQADCTTVHFDALAFDSHAGFYAGLPKKPDVVLLAFGTMPENEAAIADFKLAQETIDANYSGAVSILNIIAVDFRQRGSGSIMAISSVAGQRGRQSNFIYGSAKAGLIAYLSGLRNWCFPSGVHVMTILPGFVATKLTDHLTLPPALTASPEEVAEAIFKALRRKKNVLHVKWFWKYIMVIICSIPEPIFKKLKL